MTVARRDIITGGTNLSLPLYLTSQLANSAHTCVVSDVNDTSAPYDVTDNTLYQLTGRA